MKVDIEYTHTQIDTHRYPHIERHKNINRLNKFSLSINPECTNSVYVNNNAHTHSLTYAATSRILYITAASYVRTNKNRTKMISIMPILTLVISTLLCFCKSIAKQRLLQASTGLLLCISYTMCEWVDEWVWVNIPCYAGVFEFHIRSALNNGIFIN